jgi:hypothetical protein
MTGPQPGTGPVAPSGLAEGLARLVADGLRPKERVRALRDLGEALWRQYRDVSGLASRSAEVLAEAVSRLPIRDPDALAARYGGDTERAAGQLVDEAARLAGWMWTAAAVVPAPARAVRIITVLVHSAVEIRLIAELYAIYGASAAPRDPSWLTMVVNAWAAGRPVATAPSALPGTRDIVVRLRHANATLASQESRLARLRHRGREGAEAVRRLGWRFRRRMRPHPSTWPSPAEESAVANSLQAAGDVLRGRPGTPPEGPGGPPARYLGQAWAHHLRARLASEAASPAGDPAVLARLQAALVHQDAHLRLLGAKLRRPQPPAPGPEPAAGRTDPLRSAHTYASLADDAIDLVEEAGSRPRRLGGWPVRLRNGLVYAVLALALAVPVGLLTANGLGGMAVPVRIAVLVLSAAGLSVLACGLGLLLAGRLFRPWLGGRVARSPIAGLAIAVTVSILTLATATAMAGPA